MDRVAGLYNSYCRDRRYHLTRAAEQKQINTEEGKQMALKLCRSSGHISCLFSVRVNSVDSKTSANGSDVTAAFHLSNLCVCSAHKNTSDGPKQHYKPELWRLNFVSYDMYMLTSVNSAGRHEMFNLLCYVPEIDNRKNREEKQTCLSV